MDDSERSYGYSRDIYHGRRGAGGDYGERVDRGGDTGPFSFPDHPHREESYEYGAERGLDDTEPLSPEEAAVHVTGGAAGGVRRVGRGRYDHGRGGGGPVESQTWGGGDGPNGPRKRRRKTPR